MRTCKGGPLKNAQNFICSNYSWWTPAAARTAPDQATRGNGNFEVFYCRQPAPASCSCPCPAQLIIEIHCNDCNKDSEVLGTLSCSGLHEAVLVGLKCGRGGRDSNDKPEFELILTASGDHI